MKKILVYGFAMLLSLFTVAIANAKQVSDGVEFYRNMTNQIRKDAEFTVAIPGSTLDINYHIELAKPIYQMPIVQDAMLGQDHSKFFRTFFDRIFLNNSYVTVGTETIALTCIFVHGLDNRYAGPSDDRMPNFYLKIYFVANDPLCIGPLAPDYPSDGGIPETWDTYFYYEIKNVAEMLPKAARIRLHWNDYWADFIQ
jgi:hypothetical protein